MRSDGANLCFVLIHRQIVLSFEDLPRLSTQGAHQILRTWRAGHCLPERKIQDQEFTVLDDLKGPAFRLEGNGFPGCIQGIEQYRRGCQSAVSTKLQLHRRGIPAKLIVVLMLNEECRYREIVLRGDELQRLFIEPMSQRADHGGISGEDGASEGVDVVGGD